jgi:hypothetical protein
VEVVVSSSLVVPKSIPEGWGLAVRDETMSIDDVKLILDRFAVLEAYRKKYQQDAVARREIEAAQRWHETRIGQLMPEPEPGKRTDLNPSVATDRLLSKDQRHEFRLLAEHIEVVEQELPKGNTSRRGLIRAIRAFIREHTPAKPDAEIIDVTVTEDGAEEDGAEEQVSYQLWHGDFRDRLTELEDGSVDLILTDPPYPKDDLPLYSDLAEHAARLLGPRGLLVTYAGTMFLPEVLNRLSEFLTYGWTLNLNLAGSSSRIMGRHIIQTWKPLLVYSTGTFPSGEWKTDVIYSDAPEKSDYEWQQNAWAAYDVIEKWSPPDGLVVDPFLGVGTFGVAATRAGRRFVGVELDGDRFLKAEGRLADG